MYMVYGYERYVKVNNEGMREMEMKRKKKWGENKNKPTMTTNDNDGG